MSLGSRALVKILSTQSSQLLPTLFRDETRNELVSAGRDEGRNVSRAASHLDEQEQRLSVLHIGTPCNDTMEFFSGFRCRLQIIDLFSELPPPSEEETEKGLASYFSDLLQFPAERSFDVCLFWDLFDYLDDVALPAFFTALQPFVHKDCRAHGFSVHNPRTPANNYRYGIQDRHTLTLRERRAVLPGYKPHSQHRLNALLYGFRMERTVLLPDRRLELSLRAKPA